MSVSVEFTVEPFDEGTPGPHVDAALAAVRADGIDIEVGPFGSSFTCSAEQAADLIGRLALAAVENDATRVSIQLTVDAS